jgi:hypothetical protein
MLRDAVREKLRERYFYSMPRGAVEEGIRKCIDKLVKLALEDE